MNIVACVKRSAQSVRKLNLNPLNHERNRSQDRELSTGNGSRRTKETYPKNGRNLLQSLMKKKPLSKNLTLMTAEYVEGEIRKAMEKSKGGWVEVSFWVRRKRSDIYISSLKGEMTDIHSLDYVATKEEIESLYKQADNNQ